MKEKIVAIIKEYQGYRNAITSGEILNKLGYSITDRNLRNAINEAITIDRDLIGSSDMGFFWITNKEDLKIAKAYIVNRIEPLRNRVVALDFNWAIFTKVQPELFDK